MTSLPTTAARHPSQPTQQHASASASSSSSSRCRSETRPQPLQTAQHSPHRLAQQPMQMQTQGDKAARRGAMAAGSGRAPRSLSVGVSCTRTNWRGSTGCTTRRRYECTAGSYAAEHQRHTDIHMISHLGQMAFGLWHPKMLCRLDATEGESGQRRLPFVWERSVSKTLLLRRVADEISS